MKIKLISLELRNFKKSSNCLHIDFTDITNISADNGVGKTTIFDAFTWLLFGKNSNDEKDFNIKTLDSNNNPIHKLEHEVIGVLDIDGVHCSFSRCLKEKWVKKRGSEDSEFSGHETSFTYNEVPLSASEFKLKVDAIIDEKLFKMITSPTLFNRLKWEERRAILGTISGGVSYKEVAEASEIFKNLLSEIGCESLIDFKKRISAQKKKIKDELDYIPARIDEATRGKKTEPDYNFITESIFFKEKKVEEINSQIENSASAIKPELDKIRNAEQTKYEMESNLTALMNSARNERRKEIQKLEEIRLSIKASGVSRENDIKRNQQQIESINSDIEKIKIENDSLRNSFSITNSSKFTPDPNKCACPTCKRVLENAEEIEKELESNFNKNKLADLEQINIKGKANAKKIDELEKVKQGIQSILEENISKDKNQNSDIEEIEEKIKALANSPIVESEEEKKLKAEIKSFIIPSITIPNNSLLKLERNDLIATIDVLKKDLQIKEYNEAIESRIKELEVQSKKLNQELATLERKEFTCLEFNREYILEVEKRVNGKFNYVKWKMFEQQINGGEVEVCECTVNGVPYSDLNTASKINAGIDIINALCNHYDVSAPIFVDNRESVSELLPCKSQIINLIKVTGLNKLTIN